MEKYLGVKLVDAEECNGYNNKCYNDSDVYPTGVLFQEGYKVVYEDGYTSWSPKDVFEKAYRKILKVEDLLGIILKQPFQHRVFEEAEELTDKIDSLEKFINGEIFNTLDVKEQYRLQQQLMAMQYYITILVERIENFKQ